jgi:hypothetical protein
MAGMLGLGNFNLDAVFNQQVEHLPQGGRPPAPRYRVENNQH